MLPLPIFVKIFKGAHNQSAHNQVPRVAWRKGWPEEIFFDFATVNPHLKNMAQAGSLGMIAGLAGMGELEKKKGGGGRL